MATQINAQYISYQTYRWLSPLIYEIIAEVSAQNIDIAQDVVNDKFVIFFEVENTRYNLPVNNNRLQCFPFDFKDDSFQELIAEIKLRHF